MSETTFFKKLGNTRPFIKAAFEGFAGTGKTYTASTLAIGLHQKIGSKKPIVFYDTERALKALKPRFDKAGIEVLVKESRTLADLVKTFDYCEQGAADILVIDSLSHVWESFLQSYITEKFKRKKTRKLSFPDWGYLKPRWKKEFSDRLVISPIHVIFTGRAGYEYDHVADEDGKMTELTKTGIKMKAETETAYEPDLLFLMERKDDLLGDKKKLARQMWVLKDRWNILDGKAFVNPGYGVFAPVVDAALDGDYTDEMIKETKDEFKDLDAKNKEWAKRRDVALEKIKAMFDQMGFGTTKDEKKLKADLVEKAFGTTSWTEIESMKVDRIESGNVLLMDFKTCWLSYLKDCSEQGVKPDMDVAYGYIKTVFSPIKKAS